MKPGLPCRSLNGPALGLRRYVHWELEMKSEYMAKLSVQAILSVAGAWMAEILGGWDGALQFLVMCITVDCITGIIVAGVFKKSDKTTGGAISSAAGLKGILKKTAILMLVAISHAADKFAGSEMIRNTVVFFFIGNEGISILENMALMGVPFPSALKRAFEAMRAKGGEQNDS